MTALQLPLASGAKQNFKSIEQFQTWLQEVHLQWDWFLNGAAFNPQGVNMGRNEARAMLSDLETRISSNPADWINQAIGTVKQRFPLGFPLDPKNPVLAGLLKAFPDHEPSRHRAVGAYLWAERYATADNVDILQMAHPVCLQAIGYSAAARGRLNEGAAAAAEAMAVRTAEQVGELVRKNEVALEATNDRLQTVITDAADQLKEDRSGQDLSVAEAIKRIDDTKAAYEEVMRLKAPVDYWAEKGTEHRGSVKTYRTALAIGTVAFVLILVAVYWGGWLFLGQAYQTLSEAPWAVTIYVAGFVGAVTAIGLWLIRIVVRLYMSQHHLAADADERASLLRTYLALTESGKVSDQERSLVLAAVFRPAPDGIVKDDGAPATTPLTLLASVLDRHGK